MRNRAWLLVVAVLAGAGAALVLLPSIFRTLPNDRARYGTIVRLLSSTRPVIAVIGDSRGEAGVDTRQLTRELPGAPLALNFCSPGQRLPDSLLIAGALPPSVRIEVLVIGRDTLNVAPHFDDHSYAALYMYGYRPTDEVRNSMATALSNESRAALSRTPLALSATARWSVPEAADMMLYAAAHGRGSLAHERDDPFQPGTYDRRVDERAFHANLQSRLDPDDMRPRIDPAALRLVQEMARMARRQKRRLLLVLAPLHPDVLAAAPRRYGSPVRELDGVENLQVLDVTSQFTDAEFADPLHLLSSAAPRLTSAIVRAIEAQR